MSAQETLNVNGRMYAVAADQLGESLLRVLRDVLHIYGPKNACEEGECSSCVVLIDGQLVCACLTLAGVATGREITTIEGLASMDALTNQICESFVAAGAVQCGFCTPGFVMAARQLLGTSTSPTDSEIAEAFAGNLCRCTGYGRIIEAVRNVGMKG